MTRSGHSRERLKKVRCIFFDLDNTLYAADEIYRIGLKNAWCFFREHHPLSFKRFLREYDKARAQVKALLKGAPSARNRVLYFKRMVENILGHPYPAMVLKITRAYETCWLKMKVKTARSVCRQLARRYPIGIITNQVCLTQLQKLERIDPRSRWIRFLMTSEEVNVEKPHRKIFLEACKRTGFAPRECAVVGDDWEHDVLGAMRLGFHPVFIGRPKNGYAVKVPWVASLREVPGLFLN